MKTDYDDLNYAGTEKYQFNSRKTIEYPGTETVEWYGFTRHNFELNGHTGFIVEPRHAAPGLPWTWCLQWAEAFVPRTPALKLLERGFHHVHFDVFPTYLNKDGVEILEKFYALLRSLGFCSKGVLIGMSYGGLFSLRWAAEHPETVAAMYLDAPVCDLGFKTSSINAASIERSLTERAKRAAAYGVENVEDLSKHPLSPLNNYMPIAEAKIPIYCVRSGQDQSVVPEYNIDILTERIRSAGGSVEIFDRPYWGHHPHGFDDPQPLVDFVLNNYCF